MHTPSPAELTVHARGLHDLFSEREFDPLQDEPDALWSIPQIAGLQHVVPRLAQTRLRVVLPAAEVSAQTQTIVERAFARYCTHKIREARLDMHAWRRGALTSFLWSVTFFGVSLLLTAGVGRAEFLPEEMRTLITETLVIAGWIIMWNPMDTLIEGWVPIRDREKTFRAISAMQVTVERT